MPEDLEPLRQVLVPPAEPIFRGDVDSWDNFERRTGIRLPSDYKAFVSIYGMGRIEAYFLVLNPFDGTGECTSSIETELARRRVIEAAPDLMARKNLIQWGTNESGGEAFWAATGPDPERWTIVEEYEGITEDYDGNITSFLVDVLSGRRGTWTLGSIPVPPSYYYPSITLRRFSAQFSKTTVDHNTSMEIFRRLCPTMHNPGGSGSRDQFTLPPRGWFVNYKSEGVPNGTGAVVYNHSMWVTLPPEDIPAAKQLAQKLAEAMGVQVLP